jgi:hypothetical protein
MPKIRRSSDCGNVAGDRRSSRRPHEEETDVKHRSFMRAVVLATLAATASVSTAFAGGAGSTAAGTFTFASDYTAAKTKSVNIEISQFRYRGALAGVAVDYGTMSAAADGSFKGSGSEYCAACTVGGKTGAFTAEYTYAGSGVTYQGRLTFTRGYGKLAGLEGGARSAAT